MTPEELVMLLEGGEGYKIEFYVNLNKVSRITATRELMDMVRKKILKQEGRGRGSRFTPMMQL
jgi:Fic family protein